jgi:hypothetical protein
MSAETELYSALSSQSGLTNLVGSRIYPDAIPENVSLPAVVFVRANTLPTYTIGGARVCEFVHFPVTAWAKTRSEVEAVADQIELALEISQNLPVDRSSGYDNEVGLFAVTIETDWFTTT